MNWLTNPIPLFIFSLYLIVLFLFPSQICIYIHARTHKQSRCNECFDESLVDGKSCSGINPIIDCTGTFELDYYAVRVYVAGGILFSNQHLFNQIPSAEVL